MVYHLDLSIACQYEKLLWYNVRYCSVGQGLILCSCHGVISYRLISIARAAVAVEFCNLSKKHTTALSTHAR